MDILYEDREILVCYKESGIPVQSARIGQKDLVSILQNYLAGTLSVNKYEETSVKRVEKYPEKSGCSGKPCKTMKKSGERCADTSIPEIHVVHRLDQPVEGILVFAKTKRAASELTKQITDGTMKKTYHAVCCVEDRKLIVSAEEAGGDSVTLVDYLVKDARTNTSFVADKNRNHAKRSELSVRILGVQEKQRADGIGSYALAEIDLRTGRHHQIRVQMAHHGLPLYGDRKYNAKWQESGLTSQLALCAVRLTFLHPATKRKMEFAVKPHTEAFLMFED